MNMASRYKFSEKEIEGIEQARKENKDKRAECRLEALEMRAKGAISKEVSVATGFHAAYVTQLVAKYRDHGLDAISGNHYGGNHRNMSVEEEATIIAPFKERAEKGELVEVSEIAKAYQAAVDHPVSNGQIYFVLHRHGWRKVMPRSKHPRKASDEEIAASKKLRQHRTIASASLSRLFAPLPQFRKWEIHTVFLHFRNFELEQKSCLRLLAELFGAALHAGQRQPTGVRRGIRQLDAGHYVPEGVRGLHRGHSGVLPPVPDGGIRGKSARTLCHHSEAAGRSL